MVYLSWSILMLVGYLLLGALLVGGFTYKKMVTVKQGLLCYVVFAVFIGLLAVGVGTRQENLQRSSFDAVPLEQKEKIERNTLDRNDVNNTFEKLIKETK